MTISLGFATRKLTYELMLYRTIKPLLRHDFSDFAISLFCSLLSHIALHSLKPLYRKDLSYEISIFVNQHGDKGHPSSVITIAVYGETNLKVQSRVIDIAAVMQIVRSSGQFNPVKMSHSFVQSLYDQYLSPVETTNDFT